MNWLQNVEYKLVDPVGLSEYKGNTLLSDLIMESGATLIPCIVKNGIVTIADIGTTESIQCFVNLDKDAIKFFSSSEAESVKIESILSVNNMMRYYRAVA